MKKLINCIIEKLPNVPLILIIKIYAVIIEELKRDFSGMTKADQAANIAATLFNEGMTVSQVISALREQEDFEQHRFFELNGFLYIEYDRRFPAVKVCQVPEAAKENG